MTGSRLPDAAHPSQLPGHPLTSVIIPAHNSARDLPEQLEALRGQEGAPHFEVIVCDNNSTDATVDVARAFETQLDLRVVDCRGPASASFARNGGARAARGEILAFCDADDLVSPTWVAELTDAIQASPGAVISGALHHERFNALDVLFAYKLPPDPDVDPRRQGIVRLDVPSPFAGYLPTAAGGNFAIRREDYLRLGGMDATFPGGSEETDFAWRAQHAGLQVLSAPDAVVHYRLKRTPRQILRQQRIQQRARIYLWTIYRSTTMTGPSFSYSLRRTIADAVRWVSSRRGSRAHLSAAYDLGGSVGALEGIFKYRLAPSLAARTRRVFRRSNP